MKKAWMTAALLAAVLVAVPALSGCGGTDPSTAINNAIQNQKNIKSEHADVNMTVNVQGDLSALGAQYKDLLPLSVTIKASADADNTDPNNPKAQGNFSVTGLDKVSTLMDSNTAALIGALASIDFVVVDQHLYAKINGTWYDAGGAQSLGGLAGGMTTGITDTSTSGNASCFQNALSDTSKFGASQILSNIQDVGSESIAGQNSRHFTADINTNNIITQLANTARDCGQPEAAGGLDAAKSQIAGLFKSLKADIWVGDDNNLTQVKLHMELNPQMLASLASGLGGSAAGSEAQALTGLSMDLTVTQSQFNQSFAITKPSGTIVPIDQLPLLGQLGVGSMLGGDTSGLGGLGGLGGDTGINVPSGSL